MNKLPKVPLSLMISACFIIVNFCALSAEGVSNVSIEIPNPIDSTIQLFFSSIYPINNDGYSTVLVIHSDGSASYDAWDNYTYQGVRNERHWATNKTLSWNLVKEARDAILEEGFFSLSKQYSDSHYDENYYYDQHTPVQHYAPFKRLAIFNQTYDKTTTFEGNSIYGLLPRSSVILDNIESTLLGNRTDLFNVSMEITVINASSSLKNVNTTIRNDENFTLNGSWGTLAHGSILIVTDEGDTVRHGPIGTTATMINYWSVEAHSDFYLYEYRWNVSGLEPGDYVIVVLTSLGGDFSDYIEYHIEGEEDADNDEVWSDSTATLVLIALVICSVGITAAYFVKKKKKARNNVADEDVSEDSANKDA